jgi:hypothetical protein
MLGGVLFLPFVCALRGGRAAPGGVTPPGVNLTAINAFVVCGLV